MGRCCTGSTLWHVRRYGRHRGEMMLHLTWYTVARSRRHNRAMQGDSKSYKLNNPIRARAWNHEVGHSMTGMTVVTRRRRRGSRSPPSWDELIVCQLRAEGNAGLFHGSHLLQPKFLLFFSNRAVW